MDDITKLFNANVKAILECIAQYPKITEPRISNSPPKENSIHSDKKEANVRVIYTGGTIGMVRNKDNGKLKKKIKCQLAFIKA